MKAMIISDLLILKKYLVMQAGIALVLGIALAFMLGNIYVIAPIAGALAPFSLAFSLIALDERGSWEQFRLALPLSRSDIMCGRYASLGLVVLANLVYGFIILGLVAAAAIALPGMPPLNDLMVDFSWQAVVAASATSLGSIITVLAFVLPLVARFGMIKAVRILPIVIVFGAVIVFNLGANYDIPHFLTSLATWIVSPEGTFGAVGVAVLSAAILYVASCALSARLYERREI